ncbi:thymidylate kinase [Crucibulum laeve]|uniref:Thymidylate kinase n=1 Tax=Crucibulum laeve TaxID=68775 RepID=A0A5C3M4D8_9AGAR|nr:thymidylate kinase [Crucibulum laeve]
MPKRTLFIVIEGLDRSGKTTQTAILHERLVAAGHDTKLMKFPDRTTAIGKMIDSYLKSESELDDHAIHLLFSANRWELASTITQTLLHPSPITVLCDRYAFSGIAFTASKPADIPFEWCRAPDVGLPAPDLTIFLDISPETAKERGGYGEERYEKEEMQRKVRAVFGRIGGEMIASSERGDEEHASLAQGGRGRWVMIDAGRECEEVAKEIWTLVEPLVKEGADTPIGKLWIDKGLK